MRKLAIVLSFCVTFIAILAAPSENVGIRRNFALSDEQNLQSVIVLNRLSSFCTRNWFEDLISSQLGMTAKEFLEKIDDTFKRVDRSMNGGVAELNTVLSNASPEVRAKIIQIRDESINKVSQVVQSFLADLGLVLPALTTTGTQGSVADIIYALLRKTLEEFVKGIGRAMEDSLNILIGTMEAFRDLSTEARPEVGQALNRISETYWNQALRVLQPMIDQLKSLTDFRVAAAIRLQGSEVQRRDLLNDAVSAILGIDIEIAALETNLALLEIAAIVEGTQNELYEAVSTSADNEVRTKVMDIFESAMHDVIRDLKPLTTSLLEFQGNDRTDKSFIFDLASSLLGIGVSDFKNHLRGAIPRVQSKVKDASSKILSASAEAGDATAIKVWRIMKNAMVSGEEAVLPLMDVLRPLLNEDGESKTDLMLSFNFPQRKEEWDWANENGLEFNRDALIRSVSTILGFNITLAPQTLKWSLEKLDDLMEISLEELDSLMSEERNEVYTLKHEILEILSQSLTNIHVTLQPMLDVLLPFLPDKRRSNKEVALDIYSAINGVSSEGFVNYCKIIAERIPEITDAASAKIKEVAAKGDPMVQVKIAALLARMDTLTKLYISPFLNILRPVITPFLK